MFQLFQSRCIWLFRIAMKYLWLLIAITLWSYADAYKYLGAGVNIFKFFGDLSMRIRTAPRNDSGLFWMFRDPLSYVYNYHPYEISLNDERRIGLKVEVCDDISALYSALFRGIRIEGMEKSWKAFAASWSDTLAARKLGIKESLIKPNLSYLIVLIDWYLEDATLNRTSKLSADSNIGQLTESTAQFARKLTITDSSTLNSFISNIGSHYISSYVIGEGIFQVYVFREKPYKELKLMMKSPFVKIEDIINHFSPIYSNTIGQIMVRSGDLNLTRWIRKKFQKESINHPPSHLLEIYKKSNIVAQITNRINKQVILKLNLSLINNIINEKKTNQWFQQIIDNRIKSYELNI